MSTVKPTKRSENSSASFRREKEISEAETLAAEFLSSDNLTSFESLQTLELDFPPSWNIIKLQRNDSIILEEMIFDEESKPKLGFSLTVFDSLEFRLVCGDLILSPSKVNHITKKNILERNSDIYNILAFLNSYSKEKANSKDTIENCISKLKNCLEETENDVPLSNKLSFIIEQLELANCSKHTRRYSTSFVWSAISWMKSSPALYRQLISEGMMTLPSISYLKQIASKVSLETGLSSSSIAYLETRFKSLNDNQKIVSLILDEVK